jgi:hypothetical protein
MESFGTIVVRHWHVAQRLLLSTIYFGWVCLVLWITKASMETCFMNQDGFSRVLEAMEMCLFTNTMDTHALIPH